MYYINLLYVYYRVLYNHRNEIANHSQEDIEMKEAERKLYEKGYYLSNQFNGFGTIPNEYELADRNGNTVIDHLTEAQVIQLSEIL